MEVPPSTPEIRAAQLLEVLTQDLHAYTGFESMEDVSAILLDPEQTREFYSALLETMSSLGDIEERSRLNDVFHAITGSHEIAAQKDTDFLTGLNVYCLEWNQARLPRPDEDWGTPEVLEALGEAVASQRSS